MLGLGFGDADDSVLVDQGLGRAARHHDGITVETLDRAADGFTGDQGEGQGLALFESSEEKTVLDVDRIAPRPLRRLVGPLEAISRIDEVNAYDSAPKEVSKEPAL